MKKSTRIGWIIALALGGTAAAKAGTIHNNLGTPSGGTEFDSGWVAAQFHTRGNCPAGCTLGDITLFMHGESTTGFSLDIYEANPADDVPDFNLPWLTESTKMNHSDDFFPGTEGEYKFNPSGTITLNDNTPYWAILSADYNTVEDFATWWWGSDSSSSSKWAISGGFYGDSGPYMMKVQAVTASPVPIPPALWLMGSALAGLVVRGRRKVA